MELREEKGAAEEVWTAAKVVHGEENRGEQWKKKKVESCRESLRGRRGVGVWSNKQEEGEKSLAGERSVTLRGGEKRGEQRRLAVKRVF